MSDEVVSEVWSAEEETLDLVIETQLANGHQNLNMCQIDMRPTVIHSMTYSSACGPVHSIEEFFQAFILPYPYQSVNSVFVTATKTRMKQFFVFPTHLRRCSGGSLMSFCILTLTMSPGVPTMPPQPPATAAMARLCPNPIFSPLGDTLCLAISYMANLVVE